LRSENRAGRYLIREDNPFSSQRQDSCAELTRTAASGIEPRYTASFPAGRRLDSLFVDPGARRITPEFCSDAGWSSRRPHRAIKPD